MTRLKLSSVTLCAAASVNVAATIKAIRASLLKVEFGACILFTDVQVGALEPAIKVVEIDRLPSAAAYSEFVLHRLAEHIETDHCLIVQWDGFVLNAGAWRSEFLDCDYIGAPWPQFRDGRDVGNGGFSLRSRRLLEACQDARFQSGGPEDLAIGRTNRPLLETEFGLTFAERAVAAQFSFERALPVTPTFGFHGIFNMIPELGSERFWKLYEGLDDRRSVRADYGLLWHQLGRGPFALRRRLRLTADALMPRRVNK